MADPRPSDQDAIGPERLHPVWVLSAFGNGIRNSIALFIGVGLSLRSQSGIVLLAGIVGLLLLILGYRVLQWLRISYQAADGAVTLKTGILNRVERVVPVERIQNVNTVATPIDRLFNTLQLAIETAGTGERLTLETLSFCQAADVQRWIDRRRAGQPIDASTDSGELTAEPEPAAVLHVMSTGDLLVAGLTSGRVGPALALIAAAIRFGTDIVPERYWNRLPFEPDDVTTTGILLLLVVAALLAWVLSVISAFIAYWQFTLTLQDDAITITTGLLDRRRITIPLSRIQAISIVEGPLRQPFGYASLMIESASRFAGESEDAGSQTLIPLIKRNHIPSVLEQAAPEYVTDADLRLDPLPRRALRRYLVAGGREGALITGAAIVLFTLLPRTPWWYGLALLPLVPVLLLYGYAQFRDAGWAIDDRERVIIRRRSIDRITTIAPRERVQLRTLSQSLFQRRADLTTMTIKLAGRSARGTMRLVHLDAATGLQIVERLGPRRLP